MRVTQSIVASAMVLMLGLGAAACGGSSDASGGSGDASTTPSADGDDPGENNSVPDAGEPGTLTIDGAEVALGAGRCLLEEQPAAAGGGAIELTAQASGTDADGEPVTVDFTRYSAESQFAGDDLAITIGDPFSGEATQLQGSADSGAVSIDGSTVSATDFAVGENPTATQPVSFTINC